MSGPDWYTVLYGACDIPDRTPEENDAFEVMCQLADTHKPTPMDPEPVNHDGYRLRMLCYYCRVVREYHGAEAIRKYGEWIVKNEEVNAHSYTFSWNSSPVVLSDTKPIKIMFPKGKSEAIPVGFTILDSKRRKL